MRLLKWIENDELSFTEVLNDVAPPYAVLSHTWGTEEEEVNFEDIIHRRSSNKTSYEKIRFGAEQAKRDGLSYFWVDTCCINNADFVELQEAINCMFSWFRNAQRCYVLLSDVSYHTHDSHSHEDNHLDHTRRTWESAFRTARWFTRGWTLQELLAPLSVSFFSRQGDLLGTKDTLASLIEEITTIPVSALQGAPLSHYSIEQRMDWAARRQTRRPEDRAYSLLGIFNVSMPLMYGEGMTKAFARLRREVEAKYECKLNVDELCSPRTRDTDASSAILARSKVPTLESIRDLLLFEQMGSRQSTIKPAYGTSCEWLFRTEAYLGWMSPEKFDQHRGFLWILGKPGSGKSTLVKFAYAKTSRSRTPDEVVVSYFFNARGTALEKSTLGMYRSVLFQIMDKVDESSYQVLFNHLATSQSSWTSKKLGEVMTSAVQALGSRRLRCFIDAIDECNEQEVRDMVLLFEELGHTMEGRLHVCFASRHYPIMNHRYGFRLIVEDESGHDEGLANYVHDRLRIGKERKLEQVKKAVHDKARGIYVWVVLVIDILNAEYRRGSISSLWRRLDEIPEQLSGLFLDITGKGNANTHEMLLCTQWIMFARRPLQLEEFYFAMMAGLHSASVDTFEFDPELISREDMERFLLHCSMGLAETTRPSPRLRTDEETNVQFIHESVTGFLGGGGGLSVLCPEVPAHPESFCHRQLRQCCQRYLTIDLEKMVTPTDELLKASSNDAAKFRQTLDQRFPFLRYAVENLFYHANEAAREMSSEDDDSDDFLNTINLRRWVLLCNLVEKYKTRRHTEHVPLVYILAEQNSAHLLRTYFKQGSSLPATPHERYRHPLLVALAYKQWDAVRAILESIQSPGLEEIMEILRNKAKIVVRETTASPLHWALDEGIIPLAELLIASPQVDLSIEDAQRHTPLSLAAKSGCNVVVEQLLARGGIDFGGLSALYFAASEGHTGTVKLLLDSAVKSDTRASHYDIATAAAISRGHQETARLLLDVKSGLEALQITSAVESWEQTSRSSSPDGMANLESTLGPTLLPTDPTSAITEDISMGRVSLHKHRVEFDTLSIADTLGLGGDSNAKLVSFIAGSLFDSVSQKNFSNSRYSRTQSLSMQSCLRSFAAMLCLPEHGSAGLDSARFIWRHHHAIAEQYFDMMDDLNQEPRPLTGFQREPEVPISERTTEWLDSIPVAAVEDLHLESEVPFVVDDATHDTMSEDEPALDGMDELSPELLAIEQTVTRSGAWQWLIKRMAQGRRLTYWESTVMTMTCTSLPRLTIESGVSRQASTYQVFWDPVAFLRDEYSGSRIRLKDAITVTESSGDYYACTCAQYLKMVWPSLATTFLDVLQEAIEDPITSPKQCAIQPNTTVIVHLHVGYIIVAASGPLATVMEIGEQLAWLGSACKASRYTDRNFKSTTKVTTNSIPSSGIIDMQIDYTTEPLSAEENHSCWHKFFRYVRVATNFPIPVREKDVPGLETGLEVMVSLGETSWATVFNDRFMLKGFSSLLYPVKQAADHLIWHFVHAREWRYLPHIAGSGSCLDRLALAGGDISWLRRFRHFIAWTSDAETHTGTEGAEYNIGEPSPNSYFSNLSLQTVTISAGKYIPVGATIGPGGNRMPFWSAPFSEYLRDMVQASHEWALLYDADDKRAWLVDAASALLHITVAQLRVGPEVRYWNRDAIQQLKYPQPGGYCEGGNPCLDMLLDKSNRNLILFEDDIDHGDDPRLENVKESTHVYRFQHLVHDNWKKLAQILELHASKPAAMELRFTARDRLVGWSFRSMVYSKALLTPKMIYLDSEGTGPGWVSLVRKINAAVLVGRGFGDIIRPSNLAASRLCRGWSRVPIHRDYLTVTTRTLEEIAASQGCRFPDVLSENMRWVRARNPFESCHSDHGREDTECDHAQVLSSSCGKSNCSASLDIESGENNAAVIFANRHKSSLSRFRKRFKSDPKGQVVRSPERDTPTGLDYESTAEYSRTTSDATNSGSLSATEEMSSHNGRSHSTLATGPMNDDDVDVDMADILNPSFRSFVYAPDRPFHPAVWPVSNASTGFPSFTGAEQAVSRISCAVHDSVLSDGVTAASCAEGTRSGQGLGVKTLRRKRRFSAPFIQGVRSVDGSERQSDPI